MVLPSHHQITTMNNADKLTSLHFDCVECIREIENNEFWKASKELELKHEFGKPASKRFLFTTEQEYKIHIENFDAEIERQKEKYRLSLKQINEITF